MRFFFNKKSRILKKSEFSKLQKSGLRKLGSFLAIDYKYGQCQVPRLGITVPSSFGNAVSRNKFKRKAREAFRKIAHLLPSNLEINLYPRSKAKTAKEEDFKKEILIFKDF